MPTDQENKEFICERCVKREHAATLPLAPSQVNGIPNGTSPRITIKLKLPAKSVVPGGVSDGTVPAGVLPLSPRSSTEIQPNEAIKPSSLEATLSASADEAQPSQAIQPSPQPTLSAAANVTETFALPPPQQQQPAVTGAATASSDPIPFPIKANVVVPPTSMPNGIKKHTHPGPQYMHRYVHPVDSFPTSATQAQPNRDAAGAKLRGGTTPSLGLSQEHTIHPGKEFALLEKSVLDVNLASTKATPTGSQQALPEKLLLDQKIHAATAAPSLPFLPSQQIDSSSKEI